jgi:hypothetical protein
MPKRPRCRRAPCTAGRLPPVTKKVMYMKIVAMIPEETFTTIGVPNRAEK